MARGPDPGRDKRLDTADVRSTVPDSSPFPLINRTFVFTFRIYSFCDEESRRFEFESAFPQLPPAKKDRVFLDRQKDP